MTRTISQSPPSHGRPDLPYGLHEITEQDIAAVVQALRGDSITTGPVVDQFEARLCEITGARYAVAVSSGTAALHVAMLAASLGAGDRVLTTPNTFLASANCAAYVGATPDFVDIDPRTYNLSVASLHEHWTSDVRAVVAVDFAGQCCPLPEIAGLARDRGALVVADASHSIGSSFVHEGQTWRVGGHPWADMTTFSFHPVKTVTTGEGGAIVTSDGGLAQRCRQLRNHGITRDPADAQTRPWHYQVDELGFNYRISDLQCALGCSQLSRLDEYAKRRCDIVARYNKAFGSLDFVVTPYAEWPDLTSWHLYVVQLDFDGLGISRGEAMKQLAGEGITTQVHYIPVHLQPYYRRTFGYGEGKCPNAEQYSRDCLTLPLYPLMSAADVAHVISCVSRLAA